jgi:hypothetical protein
MNMYNLDDKVLITGKPAYGEQTIPENSIGIIIKIRHRYANTPNEYFQYKVHVEGYEDGDDLTNLYTYSNLKLVV